MTIIASADGSALGNPGPAGWAWYIDPTSWRAGGWAHGTNNMGELTAVLDLLESTRHRADEPLTVYCDSQYVINSITKWMPGWKKKGWKKRDGKPVMNVDIMKALDRELSGRTVHFEWVKGHAGHELNEAADERARAMATAYQAKRAPEEMPVGPGFRGGSGPAAPRDPAVQSETAAAPNPVAGGSEPVPPGAGAPVRAAPGADPEHTEPDLFSELADLQRADPAKTGTAAGSAAYPGGSEWPAHLLAEALERETAILRAPEGGASALLHPDLVCVDARGRAGAASGVPVCSDPRVPAGELRLTGMGGQAYHVSYRAEDDASVTRRSSVWVRQDQHNEMGPWLLRYHQVTAED